MLGHLVVWVLVCALLGVYASGWPVDNRLTTWVEQLGERRGFDVLIERFGGDEGLLVRLDGVELREKETTDWIAALDEKLGASEAVTSVVNPLTLPGAAGSDEPDLSKLAISR